jgi:hypothetical protein
MNVMSLLVSVSLCFMALTVQYLTGTIIQRIASVRREVMASRERCPQASGRGSCHIRIAAKSFGQWQFCDAKYAPSGADLPMHRWFRVSGTCDVKIGSSAISLPIPPQVVYR